MVDVELYTKRKGDKVYYVYDTPEYITRDRKSIRLELTVTMVKEKIICCKSDLGERYKFYLKDGYQISDYCNENGYVYSSKEFYQLKIDTEKLRKELIDKIKTIEKYDILCKIKTILN